MLLRLVVEDVADLDVVDVVNLHVDDLPGGGEEVRLPLLDGLRVAAHRVLTHLAQRTGCCKRPGELRSLPFRSDPV